MQEEKKEEREKSPHTPLKEKEARKEENNNNKNNSSRARTREASFVKPTVEEIAALKAAQKRPSHKTALKRLLSAF